MGRAIDKEKKRCLLKLNVYGKIPVILVIKT